MTDLAPPIEDALAAITHALSVFLDYMETMRSQHECDLGTFSVLADNAIRTLEHARSAVHLAEKAAKDAPA